MSISVCNDSESPSTARRHRRTQPPGRQHQKICIAYPNDTRPTAENLMRTIAGFLNCFHSTCGALVGPMLNDPDLPRVARVSPRHRHVTDADRLPSRLTERRPVTASVRPAGPQGCRKSAYQRRPLCCTDCGFWLHRLRGVATTTAAELASRRNGFQSTASSGINITAAATKPRQVAMCTAGSRCLIT